MSMLLIQEISQQAIATHYLTIEAEKELKKLLQNTKYGTQEINAFTDLQKAVMEGLVKQESRLYNV
jgi:hypothetical protein